MIRKTYKVYKVKNGRRKKAKLKEFEARYALYLGHAMLRFQHWESIVAPYNFGLV
jgi:hypothetical protein